MMRTSSSLPRLTWSVVAFALLVCGPLSLFAQTAPNLGQAGRFAVLAASGVTGSTGTGTTVNGDVGSFPTSSISNFPPSTVTPPFVLRNPADAVVQQARTDAIAAYEFLVAQGNGTLLGPQLSGVTITPGIYSFASTANLASTGTLTFNGAGIYILQVPDALTFGVDSNVAFLGGANPCNVYFRIGTSATLNGDTFGGNVLADESITVGSGANVLGRLLAGTGASPADPDGAVTMAGSGGNTVGGCSSAVTVCSTITVNPASLPSGNIGSPFSATITATGGTGAFTFAVTSGALPAGLTLNGATGAITGTPTAAAPANFTITATDAAQCTGFRSFRNPIGAISAPGIPALDHVGLILMMVLLAGVGLFVTSRLSS